MFAFSRLCRAAFLAFALLAGSHLTAAERWLTARTAHFEMFSSASEAESKRILVALEQFRANFLAAFPLRGASEPRTTVVLFRSDRQFRPYKPLYQGQPKAVAGYFVPGPDEVVIALTTESEDGEADPIEIIFHEYVHLLLHIADLRVPLWFNEGLAEVYSTFRVENDQIEFGQAIEGHVTVLREVALLPLSRLFAIDHTSSDYNEEQRAGIFYAQSWALMHFFVCGEKKANAKKLARFINRLGATGHIEASFREAFATDYKTMENALRSYLDGGRYYKTRSPSVLRSPSATFSPAGELEREIALLNLRWRVHHSADTAHRLHELLDEHPNTPRAHELLAAIAAVESDEITANERRQRAAEFNSDNAYTYIQLVREGLRGFERKDFLDARLPEARVGVLRQWLARAFALSPDHAEALELAAFVEAVAEKIDPRTINRVQKKAAELRDPSGTLFALAIVRWRALDVKTAHQIVDALLSRRSTDAETREAATLLRARLPLPAAAPPRADATTAAP